MSQPLIAFTLGDPAGIGPETIARAWSSALLEANCRAVVVGNAHVLRRALRLVGSQSAVVEVDDPQEALADGDRIACLSCGSAEAADVPPGKVDARGGQAAYDALVKAAELALAGRIDGIVTGPLSKTALHAAGHHYPGHTELLAEICGAREVAMMLYLGPSARVLPPAGLGVVHVTLHMSLRRALDTIDQQQIVAASRLAHQVMGALLREKGHAAAPCIGVCAVNPHGGEGGLFGSEEVDIIAPAVEQSRQFGLEVTGPLPADTLLRRAAAGEFDAVVAMYHDQGHIALKLLGMHRAVNITLGLPIVRTSVAYGTAFDLAWQGRAECDGVVEAARVAAKLIRQRAR